LVIKTRRLKTYPLVLYAQMSQLCQFLIYPGIAARWGEELLEEISKSWLKIKSLKMAMDKNRIIK